MSEKLAPQKRHAFVHEEQTVYEWDQTLDEVNIYISLPQNAPAKMFYCTIKSEHIEVGIKGNPAYLNFKAVEGMDHAFCESMGHDASVWIDDYLQPKKPFRMGLLPSPIEPLEPEESLQFNNTTGTGSDFKTFFAASSLSANLSKVLCWTDFCGKIYRSYMIRYSILQTTICMQ